MNSKQSTNSTQDKFIEVAPTTVPPGQPDSVVTFDDVIETIDKFLSNTSHGTYQQTHHMHKGLSKSVGSKITIPKLINNFNMLILDHVNNSNRDMSLKQKNILKHYLESVSNMSKILDNIEIKVAGDELLCYIVGYMIKTLKNVNVNTLYDDN